MSQQTWHKQKNTKCPMNKFSVITVYAVSACFLLHSMLWPFAASFMYNVRNALWENNKTRTETWPRASHKNAQVCFLLVHCTPAIIYNPLQGGWGKKKKKWKEQLAGQSYTPCKWSFEKLMPQFLQTPATSRSLWRLRSVVYSWIYVWTSSVSKLLTGAVFLFARWLEINLPQSP